MHTTELTKQNATSRIHDPRTCLNLRFQKIYRHCVRYFLLWIMSHWQNQLEWKNRRDTDRSRLLCRLPFSLENQHTIEPRCSVVCVYAARLCASRLGGVEGHPCYYSLYKIMFILLVVKDHLSWKTTRLLYTCFTVYQSVSVFEHYTLKPQYDWTLPNGRWVKMSLNYSPHLPGAPGAKKLTSFWCIPVKSHRITVRTLKNMKQSGTKPNLVAKFWPPTLVTFL